MLADFRASVRLLATRRFGTFVFASFLSNIGTAAQQVAQPWLLLSLGASSFLLGVDQFALGAPAMALLLAGGVLAHHANRRRIVCYLQSLQMLCPILIVVLLLAGHIEPWMIIGCSLVVGITDALSMPSFGSIVPSIVERNQIAAGMALNSTQFNVARIVGPAIAGTLLATLGAVACFGLNAVSYVPFLLIALWVLPKTGALADGVRADSRGFFGGIREIVGEPALRGALISVALTSVLCMPLLTFCPVLVKEAFQGDVMHFSASMSAFGVGGLLGAIVLLGVGAQRDRRRLSSLLGGACGAVLVLCAFDPWLAALPALFVAAGVAMAITNVSANTFIQAATPQRLRGEATSLFMLALRGGMAAGGLLTGVSVTLWGVREAILIDGVLAIIAYFALSRAWWDSAMPRTTGG